jgi:hypothetical protein
VESDRLAAEVALAGAASAAGLAVLAEEGAAVEAAELDGNESQVESRKSKVASRKSKVESR